MEHLRGYQLSLSLLVLVLGAAGVLATLLVVGLVPAIVVAALVVPVTGVVVGIQARIYERVPIGALALAAAAGGLAGAVVSLLERLYTDQFGVAQMTALVEGRLSLSLVLLLGVTMPLFDELLKLVGPLLLRRWPGVRRDVSDGIVLGLTSGVGFAAISLLVNYWPLIRDGYSPTDVTGLLTWAVTLLGLAILRPLVHAANCGLVVAGAWAAMERRGPVIVPVAVGFGGAVFYGVADLLLLSRGGLTVLTLHGVALAVLVMTLRFTLREASPVGGAQSPSSRR